MTPTEGMNMEWISVKDRLPEIEIKDGSESKDVLVLDSDGTMYVGYLNFYAAGRNREKDEYLWSDRSTGCGCCSNHLTPTHWMPLPKLPKEK